MPNGINYGTLKRLTESAQRKGPEDLDKACGAISEALETGELKPEDFSFRSLFESLIQDGREIVDSWNPRNGGHGEINFNRLLESDAINSAAFSNISKQIVYTKVLEGYKAEQYKFSALIPSQPTQFNGERIPGIASLGDRAQVVREGGEYPLVGTTEDYIDTPQTTKRGLKTALTKEALFFDRTGRLLPEAMAVGQSLGLNKEKRAIDCIIDENTTVHRYNRKQRGAVASFGDNSGSHDWDNLQASNGLVDYTDVNNIELLLAAIRDANTGEPLDFMSGKIYLICAPGLYMTALNIRNATEIVTVTPGYATSANPIETRGPNPVGGRFEVLSSQLLADRLATDTDWFYGDPTQAAVYMENWPLTTVQAPPNVSDEFNRDIVMQFKSSERGQYAVIEPRRLGKSTV
jgi:hypothetical protein